MELRSDFSALHYSGRYTTIFCKSICSHHSIAVASVNAGSAAREQELLGVPYFHVVLTRPHELNELCQRNATVLSILLFRARAETVLELAADPKHLGAAIGFSQHPPHLGTESVVASPRGLGGSGIAGHRVSGYRLGERVSLGTRRVAPARTGPRYFGRGLPRSAPM